MSYEIARPIALVTVAAGSAWLIARYRIMGWIMSVVLGSIVLYLAYHAWPIPPGEWDEDGEEIHFIAPIILTVWCFLVWLVVGILTNFKKDGKFCP